MGVNDPHGWGQFGPNGMIDRIAIRLLHNRYTSFGFCSFREGFCFACMDPRGMVGMIYKEDY